MCNISATYAFNEISDTVSWKPDPDPPTLTLSTVIVSPILNAVPLVLTAVTVTTLHLTVRSNTSLFQILVSLEHQCICLGCNQF